MSKALRLGVVGVGRIGVFHARHAQELGLEGGGCELVAVVDAYGDTARRVAQALQPRQRAEIRAFSRVEDLLDARLTDAAVVASRTEDHDRDARALIDAGHRVLLEKPLTHSVETARDLVRHLSGDERKRRALMQAFMRRFDEPLRYARALLKEGRVGRPFKVVSVLEDPAPPPVGYNSPGILTDMAIHNADEVIWMLGERPESASALGANLYNFKVSPVKEDFDDAFVQVRFSGGALAQVQVSRNHVAGYRNETWVFGDGGVIHVGGFQEDPLRVTVEVYGRGGEVEKRAFQMRDYGEKVPVFLDRFGPAYREEMAHFVERCLRDEPFSVTQEDGLRAMQVVEAGVRSLRAGGGEMGVVYA